MSLSQYKIEVQDVAETGVITTIETYSYLKYGQHLNSFNKFVIAMQGTGAVDYAEISGGKQVRIYRNNNLEFRGIIGNSKIAEGGHYVITGVGWEIFMKYKGISSAVTYSGIASATILTARIGNVDNISAGSIVAGNDQDHIFENETEWDAISEVVFGAGQDWWVDYSAKTFNTASARGSASSVMSLVSGIDVKNVVKEEDFDGIINKLNVVGAGTDVSSVPSHLKTDATSVTAYGDRWYPTGSYVDKSLHTDAQCQKVAEALIQPNPAEYYSFEVIDSDILNDSGNLWSVGDKFTLISSELNINGAYALMGFQREVRQGLDKLSFKVGTYAQRDNSKTFAGMLGGMNKNISKQGASRQPRTLDGQVQDSENCDANDPLVLKVYVASDWEDPFSNLNLLSVQLVYYQHDYRKFVPSATDGHTHDDGTYGVENHLHTDGGTLGVDNHYHGSNGLSTDSSTSDVTYSSLGEYPSSITYDSFTGSNLTTSWQTIESFLYTANGGDESVNLHLDFVSQTTNDVYVYVRVDTGSDYYPHANGIRLRMDGNDTACLDLTIPNNAFSSSGTQTIQAKISSGSENIDCYSNYWMVDSHKHTVNSVGLAGHSDDNDPDVSGSTGNENPSVTTGDSGSTQADINIDTVPFAIKDFVTSSNNTRVYIYDPNGVQKHDSGWIGNTSGTYDLIQANCFNSTGLWTVYVYPNNTAYVLATAVTKYVLY